MLTRLNKLTIAKTTQCPSLLLSNQLSLTHLLGSQLQTLLGSHSLPGCLCAHAWALCFRWFSWFGPCLLSTSLSCYCPGKLLILPSDLAFAASRLFLLAWVLLVRERVLIWGLSMALAPVVHKKDKGGDEVICPCIEPLPVLSLTRLFYFCFIGNRFGFTCNMPSLSSFRLHNIIF